MILTFDGATYSKLLAEIAPRAIETEEEYDRLLAVAERLTFAKNVTSEERALSKKMGFKPRPSRTAFRGQKYKPLSCSNKDM